MNNRTCETCGNEKEMYYGLWCPLCEKPQRKTVRVLNLLQCMTYIETKYFPEEANKQSGYRDENNNWVETTSRRFWLAMSEQIKGNDIYIDCPFYSYMDYPGDWEDEQVNFFVQKMIEEFDLKDDSNTIWEVSW